MKYKFSIILFLIGLCTVSLFLFIEKSYFSILIAALLPLITTIFLLNNKREVYLLLISNGVYYILITVLSIYFYYDHQSYFTIRDGGDDLGLYSAMKELSSLWQNGNLKAHLLYSHYSGYGYVLFGAFIDYFLSKWDGFDLHTIKIFNSWIGSLIPIFIYRISQSLRDSGLLLKPFNIALFSSIYPTMIYYSSVGHRDIWIALFTVIFIYSLFLESKNKYLLIIFSLFVVFLFRPFSFLILVIVFLTYYVLLVKDKMSNRLKYIVYPIIAISISYIFISFFYEYIDRYTMDIAAYQSRAELSSGADSFAMRLYNIPSPLSEISRFIYGIYTPIPPIRTFQLDNVIFMIGHIVWYMMVPLIIYIYIFRIKSIYKKNKKLFVILFYMVILLIGISLTSLDFRHKTAIYPFGIIVYMYALNTINKKKILSINLFYVIFLMLLLVIYYAVKIL